MRTFCLKNADTDERYSLMSMQHYFSDPAGLGTNYDIAGANTGRTFVVANKQRAINAPSGNMNFANYDEYNRFIKFCNCANLQFCYKPTDKEYMMDVSLASCEKTEAAANGYLTCPVTFNGLSQWYFEETLSEIFHCSDSILEHASFQKSDLMHLGKAGFKSEISLKIDFAQATIDNWYLMEMGLVYDEMVNGVTKEERKLFASFSDEVFSASDTFYDLLILNSNPQHLCIQKRRILFDTSGVVDNECKDLYKVLLPCDIPPFICTDKDVYLFICAVPENSSSDIVGVKARCKRFVESV